MVIFAVGFIVSLIPSIALYFWFKGLKSDQLYKESCKKAFINGLIAVFPVILLSAIFALLKNLLFANVNLLLYAAVHCFIVLALAEELAKYFMGRKTIDLMRTNSLDEVQMRDFENLYNAGYGYGFGVRTLVDKYKGRHNGSLGAFGWTGAFGTWGEADPEEGVAIVYMHNMLPNKEAYYHLRVRTAAYGCIE